MNTFFATMHPALPSLLTRYGVPGDVSVFSVKNPDPERAYSIYVRPHDGSSLLVTEIRFRIPAKWKGQELSIEQIEACNPSLTTFVVKMEN